MTFTTPPLPWLTPESPFPSVEQAWPRLSDAPGLLAAGADLSVSRLVAAYQRGIFPWYADGQPILWWSTDPRMVLAMDHFRLHASFAKTVRRFAATKHCEIRIDHDFPGVIQHCADAPRARQQGTWIVEPMRKAYTNLHEAGYAHSVETWVSGELVGGLYCVAIGKAVFGESMFSLQSDASKIALAALVALCRSQGVVAIDCQQETPHLHSLGARPVPRADFLAQLEQSRQQGPVDWSWKRLYWDAVVPPRPSSDV